MAAGVLFFDTHKKVLIVKPTYKKGWGIPGGVIDHEESPRDAAIREVREEIGLDINDPELVSVGYARSVGEKTEALHFTFYGGILRDGDIAQIVLQEEELEDFRFVTESEALTLLTGILRDRFHDYLKAVRTKEVLYVE
jgi:ADP-ribose pyrophosphatase YjhB (NUDIX family)